MWYLLKNSLAVKKDAALFKIASVKSWNQRGGQEMAVMVAIGWLQNFNNNWILC